MIWDELQRLRTALAELDQEQTGVTRALEAFSALEDVIAEVWTPAPRVDLIAEPLPEPRQPAYQKVFYQDALYYVKQEELRKARAYEADLAMLKQRGQKVAQAYEREYAVRLFAPLWTGIAKAKEEKEEPASQGSEPAFR